MTAADEVAIQIHLAVGVAADLEASLLGKTDLLSVRSLQVTVGAGDADLIGRGRRPLGSRGACGGVGRKAADLLKKARDPHSWGISVPPPGSLPTCLYSVWHPLAYVSF